MQGQLELEVSGRETRGKNEARRLRVAGKIPATLYGLGEGPLALGIDAKRMTHILSSRDERNKVLALSGGASGTAMAVDYQVHPVSGLLLHVDLKRVDPTKPVVAAVPIVTVGVAYGVKTEGGMEDLILRECRVEGLPGALPEKIEIDITELHAGQSKRLGDLDLGADVTLVGDPNTVVVRIVGKKVEDETAEGEEEAAPATAAAPADGKDGKDEKEK